MRQIVSVFLTALLFLGASGCDNGPEEPAGPDEPDRIAIQGETLLMGQDSPDDLYFFLATETIRDSVAVGDQGSFSLEREPPAADSVRIWIDERSPGPRDYHPSWAKTSSSLLDNFTFTFLLVPRRWEIASGVYEGEVAEISVNTAYRRADTGERRTQPLSFYPRLYNFGDEMWEYFEYVWEPSDFPVATAFDRRESSDSITAEDSIVFWAQIDSLERRLGMDVFKPSRKQELPDDAWVTVFFGGGVGAVKENESWLGYEVGLSGRDTVDNFEYLPFRRAMLAAMGFGRTCEWTTVLPGRVDKCDRSSVRADYLTKKDVAYVRLFYRIRGLQINNRVTYGLSSALKGERVILLDLKPEYQPPESSS